MVLKLKMRFLLAFLLLVAICAGKSVEGPRRAVVTIQKAKINGKIVLEQASSSSPVKIRGTVFGLEPGMHGMHVHEGKQLGAACEAVGIHFNPTGKHHGGPRDPNRHVGDLGNIKTVSSSQSSRTEISVLSQLMSLYEDSPNSVLNRALVIHAGEDDLGRGQNPESLKNGNAGAHIACGLIELVDIKESSEEQKERPDREHHGQHNADKRRDAEDKPWKEYAPSYTSQIPTNMNVEGLARPDLSHHDSFELKTAVPTHKFWKAGKVYEYDYSGFISTGIMGVGPKLSGGSIQGRLVVEPVDEHTVNIALKSLNGKMFNEDILEELIKANPGQEVRILDQEHLEKPMQLKMTNGKIESVLISKEEPLWTVNFKRALAAQLQLQLDGSSGVFHKMELNNYYAENAVYHAMEGCTSGECQTWYHISRIPMQQIRANPQLLAVPELCDNSPVYEIVKNRDFDKCHTLPIYNYISTPSLNCNMTNGAGCENAKSHVDIVRILGCKVDENTFVVQRIKTIDRLVVKPLGYETEAIEGLTVQHLHLVSIQQRSSAKLNLPRDVQSFKTLTYSFEEERATSGSKMSQPDLRSDNKPMVMDVEDQVALKESERLLMEIVNDLESTQFYADPSGKFVADKMDMLRKAMSNLDYAKLTAFVNKFATPNPDESSTINQVVVDALVMAGTNPSLMIVRDWILKGRLQGDRAANVIAMLPATIKTPTKELLSSLIELLKSPVVSSHQQLKFAAALSVSRIVYQACVNTTSSANMFPKMAMGDFCSVRDSVVARQLVPWLSEQLKKATDEVERIAMLAALGNIGHEIILPSVLPHISSCEPGNKFEAEWYERHRRSMRADEEEPLVKKEWRKKWMAYKKKHDNKEEDLEDLIGRFESELKEDKKDSKKESSKKHGKDHRKGGKKEDKEELKSSKKGMKEEVKSNKKDSKEEQREIKAQIKDAKAEQKQYEKEVMKAQDRFQDDDDEEIVIDEDEEDLFDPEDEIYSTEGVEDQAMCNILRTKAIYALSTLALDKKEIVSKILMPIYFNKAEETEVRLAALSLLFISNPPMAFWERAALSTWTESNDQISHYIYTTIASLVSNKDPKRRDITQRAEAVLPMMKPMRWTSFISSNILQAGYQEKSRLGFITKTVNFPGLESFIPSNHYNSLYVTAGPWFSRIADIAINSKQPEKFLDRLMGKPGLRNKSNKDESAHIHPELQKIDQDLKIEARATGQPEIFIYANLMDNYQRFLAITPQSIEKMVEKLVRKSMERNDKEDTKINFQKMVPLVDVFVRIPSAMGLAYSTISQVRQFTSIKASIRSSIDIKSLKSVIGSVEGTIQPVLSLEMASKITAEVPWTRSYPTAGVQMEMILASPGRFALSADMQKGKIETSWEFMGDKLRLSRYSVIPFTTIRKVGDYTPSILIKETKPIILLDRPTSEEQVFGQNSLGLNLVRSVSGDVQATKAPSAYDQDWLGMAIFSTLPSTLRYQERSLYLDNSKSQTKKISAVLAISAKDAEDVQKDDLMDEEDIFSKSLFNSKKNVFGKKDVGIDQEWNERKFQHLFRSMAQPTGYSVDATIELTGDSSVKPRRYGTSMSYGVGDYGLSHRGKLMMEQSLDQEENFVLCVDLEAKMPKPVVVRREEFLRDDLSRTSTIKINFGKSCTNDRQITITSKMARSEEEIPSTVQSKWQDRECAKQELFGRGVSEECLTTRRLASILNKGVITIDYNDMPSVVRNVTIKASNLFSFWMGSHMSDNQVDVTNTANQIRIETVYYPIIGSMDLRVYKPKSNTFYHGINIHPVAEAVLPFNPRLTAFRAIYGGPGLCLIDNESVTTYDGLSYNVTSAGCDQLITKDCSGRYNMAVLSRQENNKKVVTVLLNREKIELNAATMKVKVNEKEMMLNQAGSVQEVRDADDDVIALIRKTSDGFIELDSPSHWIRVTVDVDELIILNSPIHRGRLCGLCGSQNGNKDTDLTGPKQCSLPEDLMDVAYELKTPAGCKSAQTPGDREILTRLQDRCMKEESSSIFGLSDSRPLVPKFQQQVLSMHIRSADSDCEVQRNRMIHRGRKRCFSIDSALKCTEGCQPTDYQSVKMAFHCMLPGSLSDELKEAMAVRPLDELAGQEVSTVVAMRLPTACGPASMDAKMPKSKSHRFH